MNKMVLICLLVLVIAGILLLMVCAAPWLAGKGDYILVDTVDSPGNVLKADIYQFGGGATVSNFSFVSLRCFDSKPSPEVIELRVAQFEHLPSIKVEWISDERLVIQSNGIPEIIRESVKDIKIDLQLQ